MILTAGSDVLSHKGRFGGAVDWTGGLTMRMLRYFWAAPTTLVGLLLVPLALVGRGRVAVVGGVLEASGGLLDILLRRT